MKIINVVGARPNFMKIAPIVEAMNAHPEEIKHLLVHTGQHYDNHMSQAFFDDLGIFAPDMNLGVGSGSHAEQTAQVMVAFEKVCIEKKPDLILVVGGVNAAMVSRAIQKYNHSAPQNKNEKNIIHPGLHFDHIMSDAFLSI